jgi:hypothetical protein
MITKPLAVTCALGAMIFSSVAPAPASQDTDSGVKALKTQVEELTKKVESFEAFLEGQAAAGKTLEAAISRAQAEGFTAGINPSSREALLGGLRAQAEAMKAAGASKTSDAPKKKESMRGKRRQR